MQRLIFCLGVLLTVAVSPLASAQTEAAITPEEQFQRDVEECTNRANEDALNADGDAKAIFYSCMAEKGHSEDALDAIGEEQ